MKFKEGDKVIVIYGDRYLHTTTGSKGIVTDCSEMLTNVRFTKLTGVPVSDYYDPTYPIRTKDLALEFPRTLNDKVKK